MSRVKFVLHLRPVSVPRANNGEGLVKPTRPHMTEVSLSPLAPHPLGEGGLTGEPVMHAIHLNMNFDVCAGGWDIRQGRV